MDAWSKRMIAFLAILFLFGTLIVFNNKMVTVVVDGKMQKIETKSIFVGQVLKEVGIEVGEKDYIDSDRWALVFNGSRLEIKKAVPIRILVDNTVIELLDYNIELDNLLKKAQITLNEDDEVKGMLSKEQLPIELNVIRVNYESVYEEEELVFKTIRNFDENLKRGFSEVKQTGEKGLVVRTYRVRYENGEKIVKTLTEEKILKYPKDHIINYGVKDSVMVASRSSFVSQKTIIMEATAYSHTGNTTYTGVWPKVGTIAVDPKVIPLGTKLWVEGYGFGIAQDTGGLIKGKIIDLFMDTERDCLRWGRRLVKVYIID